MDHALMQLSQMKKTPPAARAIASGVGVLLSAIDGVGGNPGFSVTLTRMGTDPQGTMEIIDAMVPEAISNAVLHALLTFIAQTPELSDSSLEALATTSPEPWAPSLAAFGKALVGATQRCVGSEGRMPMQSTTTVVCVDGSRMSFLALEVAAQLRKHGRLVVLHVAEGATRGRVAGPQATDSLPVGRGESSGVQQQKEADAAPAAALTGTADLGDEFLAKDLEQRCTQQLGIAAHQFKVVVVHCNGDAGEEKGGEAAATGGGASSLEEAVSGVIRAEGADTVVLGVYGTSGARIGSLGACARWAIKNVNCATVLATPYSRPLPSPPPTTTTTTPTASSGSGSGVVSPSASLFMVVLRAERPLNVRALQATMGLMSYWHSVLVLVLLTQPQTKAYEAGTTATPPIEDVTADLQGVLDAAQVNGWVQVQPYVATKTSDQLIVKVADAEHADFLALDRADNLHSGILKTLRASVILVPETREDQ